MTHYGTLEEAALYHASVGNAAWATTGTDSARTAALVRASRALDGRYSTRFAGVRAAVGQRLAWPRLDGYDVCAQQDIAPGVIPQGVVEAAYEMALVELQRPNSLSPTLSLGRLTKSESVSGAASRSFFSPEELGISDPNSPLQAFRPTLMIVEDLLACYILSTRRWVATVV